MHLSRLAKTELRGPGPPGRCCENIIGYYCSTRKMLEETETKETIGYFYHW